MNRPIQQTQRDAVRLLSGLITGRARWENFPSDNGEVCIGGLRHFCHLDDHGIPILTPMIRKLLKRKE